MRLGRGRFLAPLACEHIMHTRLWILTRDLVYIDSHGVTHRVHGGFVINGLSTPFFLWWLWPPFGADYDEGAGLHDWTYGGTEYPRYVCDWLILDALISLSMEVKNRPKRYWNIVSAILFFVGLRLFGWYSFNKNRNRLGK